MTVVALPDRDVLYLWVRASNASVPEPPDDQTAGEPGPDDDDARTRHSVAPSL
jgi:hypothetical protein